MTEREMAERIGEYLTTLIRMPAGVAPITVTVMPDWITIDWGEGADAQEMARRPKVPKVDGVDEATS